MLFVGIGDQRVDVRDAKTHYTPKGDVSHVDQPIVAQFQRGGVPDWARQTAARELPSFRKGTGLDEDPFTRLSCFDTVQWQNETSSSDEDRELVERVLLRAGSGDYILAEKERLKPPYGKYDEHRKTAGRRTLEHVVADITSTFELAGFDVGVALDYERENGNNEQVLAALEALAAPKVAEEELVSA